MLESFLRPRTKFQVSDWLQKRDIAFCRAFHFLVTPLDPKEAKFPSVGARSGINPLRGLSA